MPVVCTRWRTPNVAWRKSGPSAVQNPPDGGRAGDLEELDEYWTARSQPERGGQYVRDLISAADQELSDPARARRGRPVRVGLLPDTREILVFKTYRIIYRIDEQQRAVFLLRFWHSHREEPPAFPLSQDDD